MIGPAVSARTGAWALECVAFHGVAAPREDHEDVALDQVELRVLTLAGQFRGLDDLVEHRLKSFRARDGAENITGRSALLTQVLVLPEQLLSVDRLAVTHAAGLYVIGTRPTRDP
jgi:hypothetical protein